MKTLLIALTLLVPLAAFAQTTTVYDDFGSPALDPVRWQFANEDGTALATASTADGSLTVNGAFNRAGVYATSRIGQKGAVQVVAKGWTGTNQILQLSSAPSGFGHFIEFGAEGTDTDGTPMLHVWIGGQATFTVRSPVSGPSTPSHPTLMRIERDGTTFRFYAGASLVYTTTTTALDNDPRVMLYGWQTSVSRWDDFAMSGPSTTITTPAQNALVGPTDVVGSTGDTTASWNLEVGYGASPTSWIPLASGTGPAGGTLAHWVPDSGTPSGALVFRLTATDVNGISRAAWTPVTMLRFALAEPFEGQLAGPSFPCLLAGDGTGVQSIAFQDNGVTFATVTGSLTARCVPAPDTDGPHVITAQVTTTAGAVVPSSPVNVTVQNDLYGSNARISDDGRAFVMPNGKTTVLIGENDGTMWPGCWDLWQNNNLAATESYVSGLAANGVNCMRIMLEDGGGPDGYIESPLGNFAFNPRDLNFWDKFLPLCSKYNMTVLLTPWDTFWMNQNWSTNPYNAANGGPCVTDRDFIVNPVARAAQKARLKFMIDRWGNSSAILAYDLLNEFDIWWSASSAERKAWIDDMAQYVQDYEYQKWGHRHMITVSTASAQPSGVIGDVQYLYPRFEFSNTHQYYGGTVNNPQNIIDPAISVNGGVKYSLQYIRDGRPYVDSESGPIDKWIADETFDNLYYHHMAWAHFASGGTGIGMRWPYRTPHYLTPGMHATQKAVSVVAKDIDWTSFHVTNADSRVTSNHPELIRMASADDKHAVIWVTEDVRQQAATNISGVTVTFSGLAPGRYCVSVWDTNSGTRRSQVAATPNGSGSITFMLPTLTLDFAITIRLPHLGDATADGVVNIADATRAMRYAAGFTRPNVEQGLNGDVNVDGVVDVVDAVHIARYAAGLETF